MTEINSIGLSLGSDAPMRLDVIFHEPGLIAFNKPSNILLNTHPLFPQAPTIIQALKQSAVAQKKELAPYAIEHPQPVYLIEPDISGVTLISLNKETTEKIRNIFGSNQLHFTFLLLAIDTTPDQPADRSCNLPLAPAEHKQQMIISHKFGKKAHTTFHRIESLGRYSLWSAHTSYLRLDQIRLHAREVGLRIPGEQKYYQENFVYLSHFKKGDYKPTQTTHSLGEKPLYDALALHLHKVSWKDGTESYEITAPLPQKFEVLLKKLEAANLQASAE